MAEAKQIKKVAIDKLIPYVNNAKVHSESQVTKIASSIREFGFLNPVLIDKDYNIIAGHGRVMAAQKLEMSEVPCLFVEGLTEAQRKAYILADNRLGELADWDMELVTSELELLQEMNFDIDLTGFELPEQETDLAEEDELPEAPEEPISKLGDIWKLGNHRVMCGDSTSQDDVDKLMNGQKADLYLTDPPYNIDYEGGTGMKIMNDHMEDKEEFRAFLRDAFASAKTIMKSGASFYIWLAGSEQYWFQGACLDVGWTVKQILIWVKNSLVLGRQDYQWQHEPCLYGWNDGSHSWYADRKQTTVLNFDKPQKNGEHPTMKPVALFDYLIKNSTKSGDVVYDSFGGSGTTIIACEQNGRIGYSMELDPKYCDVIVKRWENLTGKKAELLNG